MHLIIEIRFLYILSYDRVEWIPHLMGHTGIDQREQYILGLLHVIEDALGYVDELKHVPHLPLAPELAQLYLKVDASTTLVYLIGVIAILRLEEKDQG
jgi:hypothetical protein